LCADREGQRKSQLAKSLSEAFREDSGLLVPAAKLPADAKLAEALEVLKAQSVMLVMNKVRKDPPAGDDLLGILTAFDLL
jgi:hypothetical protein